MVLPFRALDANALRNECQFEPVLREGVSSARGAVSQSVQSSNRACLWSVNQVQFSDQPNSTGIGARVKMRLQMGLPSR